MDRTDSDVVKEEGIESENSHEDAHPPRFEES
jgi:hypothetical protein